MKRNNVQTWDEYFMGMARAASSRSKDPNTQVGAVIVWKNSNRIVSTGYNGFPNGISDDDLPWGKSDESALNNKYLYVVHAELNAILSSQVHGSSVKGCAIYTTLFPCNECTKAIIQSGITSVMYVDDTYATMDSFIASRKMLELAGIEIRKIEG